MEAALFLLCRVSPACPSAVLCLGQEFPGGEHYKFLKCPVLSGPVCKEASLENVAKLNFQFLMGAPACSWASAAELGCMQPGVCWTPPPVPLPHSPLSLGFPLALDLGEKKLDSPRTCVLSSWGGVAAMTYLCPVCQLAAG